MNRLVLAATTLLSLVSLAVAQRGPSPGAAKSPPPPPHPSIVQPLVTGVTPGLGSRPTSAPACAPGAPSMEPDQTTAGPQVVGKQLKKAVRQVRNLKWHESLTEARTQSAATGKPILWLQALGDIDGFA